MNDRDDSDLVSSLSEYLQGYSTYAPTAQPRGEERLPVTSARHRRVLSSVVAVLVAVVIGVPLVVTLLLHSGVTRSPAGVDTGVVQGTLEAVGGPQPGTPRPLKGSITLRGSDGTVFTATAGSDGVFLVRVPIGTYAVTGRSPLYDSGDVDCPSSGPATVTVGATIRVVVACQVK